MSYKIVKLGEICDFQGGNQPPKFNFIFEPREGYIRFIQIRDFKSDKNFTYIPISKKNNICKNSDILIGRYGASVGKILTGLSGAYNVALMKTIPNEKIIDKKFLYYYLISDLFQEPLKKISERSAQNGFSKDNIYDFSLTLPSLSEQQIIVAKLNAAFADINNKIDLSIQKIKKIELLKKNFLNSKLNKINTEDEITINDLCYTSDFVANGSFASLAQNVKYLDNEDYAILIRLTDYRKDFKSKLKYVSKKSYEFLKHSKLQEGDLILTNVGAYSGTPFLIPKLEKPSTLGPNAILVRPDKKKMNNEYLKIFFESYVGQSLLNSISSGTTHKKFNKTSFRKIKINVPKLNKQIDVVNKIRELGEEVNQFKVNLDISIKNCLLLKNSFFQNLIKKNEIEI